MPAIQVARTDTFEIQRNKINDISNQLFSITAGGSDLATGNLKIGDGTKLLPSLAFENEPGLGIFRANNGVIGYVSDDKKLFNIGQSSIVSFRDFALQRDIVASLVLENAGTNYDAGLYSNIPLNGGTGEGLTTDIEVTAFSGTITEDGEGYNAGQYNGIVLLGGNGSGTEVSFDVEDITGTITNAGSAYLPGNYQGVSVTTVSGSGSNATANVIVGGTFTYSGSITNSGTGYTENSYVNIPVYNTPTTTYAVTSVTNPGTPPPNNVYAINGNVQQTLTLTRGNTYWFDISDSSMLGHPLVFQETNGSILDPSLYNVSTSGAAGDSGAFVQFVISPDAPTGNIKYNCTAHDGMGATITIASGAAGNHGFGATADAEVNASGNVTSLTFGAQGSGYKPTDTLTFAEFDVGAGNGFVYTLGAFTYSGIVDSIQFVDQGSGYETGDVLSVDTADLGNVGGSGFQFTITNNPSSITNLTFLQKGSGYQVNDILTLPAGVTGITGTLNGEVTGITSTLSTASADITVADASGIVAGMSVFAEAGSTGLLAPATTVSNVSGTTVTLSANPDGDGAATLSFRTLDPFNEVVVSSTTGIVEDMVVVVASGSGTLPAGVTVSAVDSTTNTIELSANSTFPGNVTLTFTPPFGDPPTDFAYRIDNLGEIQSVSINNPGNGYEVLDTLTVQNSLLVQPETYAVTVANYQRLDMSGVTAGSISVGDNVLMDTDTGDGYRVAFIKTSGGQITYMLVESTTLSAGSIVVAGAATTYTVSGTSATNRFLIDGEVEPSITLYVGSTYRFDLSDSSNSSHVFALSKFPDGKYSPSQVLNVSGNTTQGSDIVTVTSTSGIGVGMEVLVTTGLGLPINNLFVTEIINATSLRVSEDATVTNAIVADFKGAEYTDSVTRGNDFLEILVRSDTPNLFYYCNVSAIGHENEGGYDNEEVQLTVDPNNPKVFGSAASFVVGTISTSNTVFADIESGKVTIAELESPIVGATTVTASNSVTAENIIANTRVETGTIYREIGAITVNSSSLKTTGNLNVNDVASVNATTGNLVTSGNIKTTTHFNSNDKLRITDNNISIVDSNSDLLLTPFAGKQTKIDSTSSLILPKGTTLERPGAGIAQDGSIRFNSSTDQYEGYRTSTSSWASLGGVRDLDGNTYIKAEDTVGSNDNTLWFVNDDVVSVKFTKTQLSFESNKRIRSSNTSAPAFIDFLSNTLVSVGDYLKWKNNLYEVTGAGVTGTQGNEPTFTSGAQANGTATLAFWGLAVAPLTFEDIEEIRVGPTSPCPLVINGDLRFANNEITTNISDIIIRPNAGKKVVIDCGSTLAVPAGPDTDRGVPIQGSIRYSQTTSQFEGYNGATWGSLGGVKDVDQNTYIIPETAPGQNENILYFYNDGNNSAQLTTTALDFYSVDTLRSMTSDEFEITASMLTIDGAATTLDNTDVTKTFLYSTKQFFDIGLSSGIRIDPIFRLDNTGDVYFNTGFGTGTYNGVKVFDNEFKEFELLQARIGTDKFTLQKGTVDTNNSIIYDTTTEEAAKTTIVAHNTSSGDKEFIEFGLLDDGTDVFYTEYGNITTGANLIDVTFEVTDSNKVRANVALTSEVTNTQTVNVTFMSNISKK